MAAQFDHKKYFSDDHPVILDEVTYRDIMAVLNPRDLPHRDYAPLIPFVNYVGFRQNTMKFFVPNKLNGWNVYVRFPEFEEQVGDTSIDAVEASRLLLWGGNLQLWCGCPAYKFWGSQYIQTQLQMAIIPEVRFPSIRNPHLKGLCCKHQKRVLKTLPFNMSKIATAVKQARGQT